MKIRMIKEKVVKEKTSAEFPPLTEGDMEAICIHVDCVDIDCPECIFDPRNYPNVIER